MLIKLVQNGKLLMSNLKMPIDLAEAVHNKRILSCQKIVINQNQENQWCIC